MPARSMMESMVDSAPRLRVMGTEGVGSRRRSMYFAHLQSGHVTACPAVVPLYTAPATSMGEGHARVISCAIACALAWATRAQAQSVPPQAPPALTRPDAQRLAMYP
jgi:hypothetical protein